MTEQEHKQYLKTERIGIIIVSIIILAALALCAYGLISIETYKPML